MIVSVDWLREYVSVDMPIEDLTDRLTMSGLNLEHVAATGNDTAIDLEVTSNRPDCLGHVGVAREIGVLYDRPLTIPQAEPAESSEGTADATSVSIECEDLCPQYSARVIRGIRIGPSPQWLQERLKVAFFDFKTGESRYNPINNIADITNYVMLECGQPLHAFDFAKLAENRIVVRRARAGEKIKAIDQREYELDDQMCVIADAQRPVAIGGVMGGFDTEISAGTTDVLIEAAAFAPLSIRRTARKLNLHSPSSYRFERSVDRYAIDWASRRCCELILQIAGGELLAGGVVGGTTPTEPPPPIRLRFDQVPRIVGLDVSAEESSEILTSLGLEQVDEASDSGSFRPPSWRRDLTREADLIEEVARIHGYENIPSDAVLPVVSTAPARVDRVTDRVRDALVSLGFHEAITLSFVAAEQLDVFDPRRPAEMVTVEHSSRKRENVLRSSIVPSLVACRRDNERRGNFGAELFEIARVYLDADTQRAEEEVEPLTISGVSGRAFHDLKGVLEAVASRVNRRVRLAAEPADLKSFATARGATLTLNGTFWGWMGELNADVADKAGLRDPVSVFELNLAPLVQMADLEPAYELLPTHPAIERDLNFVIDESVTWDQLAACVRESAGELLDSLCYGGQYRGKQIDAGSKSYIVTSRYRASDRTLTSDEVEAVQQSVIAACSKELGARLRA